MIKTVKRILTTAAVSAGLLTGAAQAGIITLNDNLADNQHLAAGETIAGTFDLRPFLTGSSVIDWARVTFQFADDYDPLGYTYSGSYSYGYRRSYTNDMESVAVSTLGQGSTASTTYEVDQTYSSRTVSYTSYRTYRYTSSYRCGWSRCYRTYYRTYPYTAYRTVRDIETRSIADGPFSVSYMLDSAALNRLVDEGLADFAVTGVEGDSMFRNATLEASISSVPEPSALVLVALGLGGLVYRRRRTAQQA